MIDMARCSTVRQGSYVPETSLMLLALHAQKEAKDV